MKKILLFLLFITTFITYSVDWNDTPYWYDMQYLPRVEEYLKPGDVILLSPANFLKTGHMMLVNKEKKLMDFPGMEVGFRETLAEALTWQDRSFLVLRHKDMNEKLIDEILNYIDENFLNSKYMIIFDTENTYDKTYCSLFIYNVFNKFITDPDKKLPKRGIIVHPRHFISYGHAFNVINFDEILK